MSFSLEPGDTPPEETRERPRPARGATNARGTSDGAATGGGKAAQATAASTARLEDDLAKRIEESLTRIAIALEGRDSWQELSAALREDGKRMSTSAVNFTRKVKFLRGPLVWVLSMTEPVLAFGRVVRILIGKLFGWREERREEREEDDGGA